MRRRLRLAVAFLLLGVFLYISAGLTPYFLRNLRLQRSLEEITRSGEIFTQPEKSVRGQVMERARRLGIPVKEEDVQVEISQDREQMVVRYRVEVNLPGYTVYLHFAPSAKR